jgi:hypothetical protein
MTEQQQNYLSEADKVKELKKDKFFIDTVENLKKHIKTYSLKQTELKIELHTILQ